MEREALSLIGDSKKLIFDFDGTLVDSMEQWAGQWINILEKYNIVYPNDIVKIITPLGNAGTLDYLINNLGLSITKEKALEEALSYSIPEYTYNIQAKETVTDTLKKLKEKGYSLNVLTASPHVTLDPCLKRNGIYDLFDNVWSCEDFSTTKADVNIYYMVAKRLGCTVEECSFFDDNIGSLATGKKSGMRVIGVYDQSSDEYTEEIKELCDGYIYSFSEILN